LPVAQIGKYIFADALHNIFGVVRCPAVKLIRMPFTGNFLKGIVCYLAGAFLFPRWIKPIRNLLFCGNAGGAGFLERKLGVCAKGKQFFAALKAIFTRQLFVPVSVMKRNRPLPSNSFYGLSSGLAARMAVSVRCIGVFSWQGVLP
jgi:hypothetical protein